MTDPIVEAARAVLPRYEIGEVLGRGGWGVVLAGSHRDLQRDVAIKVLSPELTVDAAVRRRFVSEARLLATFDHPHVVRIHDYVEEHETCALVMERLSGGSLRDLVRLAAPSPQRITAIVIAALHGLEHAHQRSVLHRDVKPDNIMLSGSGVPKVTDFGIGIVLGASAERLTSDGIALGTPAYMPPEQIAGTSDLGPTSDVWSTGAMLYHLLAGVPPYPVSTSVQASLLTRLNERPTALVEVAPALPGAVGEVVMRALELARDDRYPSALAFADALEAAGSSAWGAGWLAWSGVELHRTPPPAVRAGVTTGVATITPASGPEERGSEPTPSWEQDRAAPPPRRRKRLRLGIAAAAVVAVVAVPYGVVQVLDRGDDPPAKSSTDPGDGPAPPVTGDVPAPPIGWPEDVPVAVSLDAGFADRVGDVVPPGSFVKASLYADPALDYGWNADGDGATQVVQGLLQQQVRPWLSYYVLRTMGRGPGEEDVTDGIQLERTLRDPRLMKRYWTDVRAALQQLGRFEDLEIPLDVDAGVPAFLEQLRDGGEDPSAVRAVVGSSGVEGLDGIPNTAAGWAQGWARLRDELAPNVRLGLAVDQYAVGDYLVPTRPGKATVASWTHRFGGFARDLGGGFDYLDVLVGYCSAGYFDKSEPDLDHVLHPRDYVRLRQYVAGLVDGAHLPAVLDDLPFGNTVSPVMDDTDYHYSDNAVQYFLGEDRSQLESFRDVGVVGLAFAVSQPTSDGTCPCDADGDGSDDDGGYFRERLDAYVDDPVSTVRPGS